MKIYNKRGFFWGIAFLILAIAALYLFFYNGYSLRSLLACFFLLLNGGISIFRSFSRNLSDADQDERTKFIIFRARSTAFLWSAGIFLFIALLHLAAYQMEGKELNLNLFFAFLLAPCLMLLVNAVTMAYYDWKN